MHAMHMALLSVAVISIKYSLVSRRFQFPHGNIRMYNNDGRRVWVWDGTVAPVDNLERQHFHLSTSILLLELFCIFAIYYITDTNTSKRHLK